MESITVYDSDKENDDSVIESEVKIDTEFLTEKLKHPTAVVFQTKIQVSANWYTRAGKPKLRTSDNVISAIFRCSKCKGTKGNNYTDRCFAGFIAELHSDGHEQERPNGKEHTGCVGTNLHKIAGISGSSS